MNETQTKTLPEISAEEIENILAKKKKFPEGTEGKFYKWLLISSDHQVVHKTGYLDTSLRDFWGIKQMDNFDLKDYARIVKIEGTGVYIGEEYIDC